MSTSEHACDQTYLYAWLQTPCQLEAIVSSHNCIYYECLVLGAASSPPGVKMERRTAQRRSSFNQSYDVSLIFDLADLEGAFPLARP